MLDDNKTTKSTLELLLFNQTLKVSVLGTESVFTLTLSVQKMGGMISSLCWRVHFVVIRGVAKCNAVCFYGFHSSQKCQIKARI